MPNRSTILTVSLITVAVCVVLTSANLYLGPLNQDEGWYLYAAGEVADGQMVYRDFAFTQAPLLPLVYSLAWPLVERWGVAGGRFFTALLGWLAAISVAWVAGRLVPRRWRWSSALLAFMLAGINVYQSYFTTVVKTYSLCGLFLALGILALTYLRSKGRVVACLLAGAFLALAAGARISAGIALPIAGLYLLFNQKRFGWIGWVSFGIGGGLTLMGLFLPLYLASPDGFLFGIIHYHTYRNPGSLPYMLVLKAGFVSRLVQAYFVPVCLLLGLILHRIFWKGRIQISETPVSVSLLWWVVAGVTVVHFMAPFPYDDYQAVVYPVMAAALAIAWIRWAVTDWAEEESARRVTWILVLVLLASAAAAFSSPINQDWMIRGRDRIWWRMKDEPDLAKLQRVGRWLRERTDRDEVLLTQDTYLAVEAGLKVPKGMALGPFSYYPDWDREKAERLNVLNREMMIDTLVLSGARFAAFSGYGLSIRCPDVSEISEEDQVLLRAYLEGVYEKVKEVTHFGQAHTTLDIYEHRSERP